MNKPNMYNNQNIFLKELFQKIKQIIQQHDVSICATPQQFEWLKLVDQNMLDSHGVDVLHGFPSVSDEEISIRYISTTILPTKIISYIYGALYGNPMESAPVIAACIAMWNSAHSFDDFTDNAMSKDLKDILSAEMIMGCVARGSIIPFHIVGQMDVSEAIKKRLNDCFAKGLMRLFAGQAYDLNLRSQKNFSVTKLEEIVELRQPITLYAQLACELAGAPLELAECYHRFAVQMDLATSLSKDLSECFITKGYADLKNGTRTLYLSVCLEALPKDKRGWFLQLLNDAEKNEESLQNILSELRKAYMVKAFTDKKNSYLDVAKQALKEAKPKEPYLSFLEEIINTERPKRFFY